MERNNINNQPYTYLTSGFNGFLRRSITNKTTGATTLRNLSSMNTNPSQLNFDQIQISGNISDTLTIGNLFLDGATGNGRIDGRDENTNTVWRLGDLEPGA